MEKKRMTNHMSRKHKSSSKGYNPKHDDRNFDVLQADNINPEKMKGNRYWNVIDNKVYKHENKSQYHTFEQAEIEFYREHFHKQYQEQQDRYKAKRQNQYCKTFEDWMYSQRYCPDEAHFQVGSVEKGSIGSKATHDLMGDIYRMYEEEFNAHGCGYKILDMWLHCDESVPHIGVRGVWCYKDEKGNMCIGQDKALEQAGYELPDPSKKRNKHNNRKMPWSAKIRKQLIKICEQHGLDIEKVPDPSLSHNNAEKGRLLDERLRQLDAMIAEHQKHVNSLTEDEKRKIYDEYKAMLERRAEERSRDADELTADILPDISEQKNASVSPSM